MKAAITLAALALMAMAAPVMAMEVKSGEFADGATLATAHVYGKCGGGNISPSLSWSDPPAGTKSYVVTAFDPDARDTGWWHWIVFDIPASTTSLAKGGPMPADAVQGTNDFGDAGYSGACPPPGSGVHHYQFTVWAMDVMKPPFDATVDGGVMNDFLKEHALGHATITPVLQR
jgi:Raf kinase inhibitor-like YbhB/YbcL family protein